MQVRPAIATDAESDAFDVERDRWEATEPELMDAVPGPPPHPDDAWTAIVEIPLPGVHARALRPPTVPDAAAWARAFLPR